MTEANQGRHLTTEVIGQLTPSQIQELNFLGNTILQAQNPKIRSQEQADEVKANVKAVLEDCIFRGLEDRGRIWVTPDEDISPFFQTGLGIRRETANRIKSTRQEILEYFVTKGEESEIRALADTVSAFSPDLEPAEQWLKELATKRKAIDDLHRTLFEGGSQLAPEAAKLKQAAYQVNRSRGINTKPFDLDRRLFANFLINFALYRRPGVYIEAKDLVALGEVWSDPETRTESQAKLVEAVKKLAERLGLDSDLIEHYTKTILSMHINRYLDGKIDFEAIRDLEDVMISGTNIIEEENELRKDVDNSPVIVTKDQIGAAKTALPKFISLYEDFIRQAESSNSTQEAQDKASSQLIEFLKGLTPFELVYMLENAQALKSFDVNQKEDIINFVPAKTFIEALPIIYAPTIYEQETKDAITFGEQSKEATAAFIKQRALEGILSEDILDEMVLNKLPTPFLLELLNSVEPKMLKGEQRESILNLDPNTWVKICVQAGIEIENIIQFYDNPEESTTEFLIESPDFLGLKDYLRLLPVENQKKVTQGLRRIIAL